MANEKLTAKQILDRAYVDVSIANLEQRKRQIIEETERYLASELPDASDEYDAGEDDEDDDDYAGDFEEDEEW
jgi:hypothetical protein